MNHNVEYKKRLNHIEYNYYNYRSNNYLVITVTTIRCGIGTHVISYILFLSQMNCKAPLP
jgi:hypothetical protein